MKTFFYQLIRASEEGLNGCTSVIGETREGLRAFARRHSDWKIFVLGCLLFPPFLAIGAGLVFMGLVTRLSDYTQT